MMPEQGVVSIQVHTMREANPQRTADMRRAIPTPTIAPVMVCVVETVMPSQVARNKAIEPVFRPRLQLPSC